MNSFILLAEIIQDPQLRYTPDNQLAISEMLVQFPALRESDPPSTLKVIGWGNLAQEISEKYHQGDQVVLEGRLGMNTIDREGFKEKRAELTVQRIFKLTDSLSETTPSTAAAPSNVVPLGSRNRPASATAPETASDVDTPSQRPSTPPPTSRPPVPPESDNPDYDPIPF